MAPRPVVAVEVHHEVPRCLLRLRDRADAHPEPLSGEGLQFWLDYEMEAMRCGVDPDAGRDELVGLVEGSTVEIGAEEHREGHAEDFARWGRRGGLRTLALYGVPWFSLLARKRWAKITPEALAEAFASMGGRPCPPPASLWAGSSLLPGRWGPSKRPAPTPSPCCVATSPAIGARFRRRTPARTSAAYATAGAS